MKKLKRLTLNINDVNQDDILSKQEQKNVVGGYEAMGCYYYIGNDLIAFSWQDINYFNENDHINHMMKIGANKSTCYPM